MIYLAPELQNRATASLLCETFHMKKRVSRFLLQCYHELTLTQPGAKTMHAEPIPKLLGPNVSTPSVRTRRTTS